MSRSPKHSVSMELGQVNCARQLVSIAAVIVGHVLVAHPVMDGPVEYIGSAPLPFKDVEFAFFPTRISDILNRDHPDRRPSSDNRVPAHPDFKIPVMPCLIIRTVLGSRGDARIRRGLSASPNQVER